MKIILIDDDAIFAEGIKKVLEGEGFAVDVFLEAEKALRHVLLHGGSYDIILLDMLIPEISGKEICKRVREAKIDTPIVMLSGESDVEEKVAALNIGADDYITKPFSVNELVARLQALLRRPKSVQDSELIVGDIVLNPQTRQVYKDGEEIKLTLKEFSVLEYLMRYPNKVIPRDQILDHAWDFNFSSLSNIIDVHINGLRKKMKLGKGGILETVRGVGYRLRDSFTQRK